MCTYMLLKKKNDNITRRVDRDTRAFCDDWLTIVKIGHEVKAKVEYNRESIQEEIFALTLHPTGDSFISDNQQPDDENRYFSLS